MKFYYLTSQVIKIKRRILDTLSATLSEETVLKAFAGFTVRERVYHTWVLFQMFLNQVATGSGCREAIEQAIQQGIIPPATSTGTSAYCNARTRLPENPLHGIVKTTGDAINCEARKRDMIFGREVKVVDGTSVQLPDTEENQSEYPQPKGQAPGCGFPVMYICALMGLSTGAILDVALGGGSGHEHALFRMLWPSLSRGDIVLGDGGFGSYAEIAMLLKRGIDGVFRENQRKFRTNEAIRTGDDDYIVIWDRPQNPGEWVDPEELPDALVMRAVKFRCATKGFRSWEVVLYTTLLDRRKYPREKLIDLYYRRWEIELRLRDIKTTMGLELLRCKTPAGCRKELYMGLTAYNLIRAVMLDAACRGRLALSRISFAGTVQRLDALAGGIFFLRDPQRWYELVLDRLIADHLPVRPGRVEPRRLKRREKNYSYLTEPRNLARNAVYIP